MKFETAFFVKQYLFSQEQQNRYYAQDKPRWHWTKSPLQQAFTSNSTIFIEYTE